jgi:hypothetical protein
VAADRHPVRLTCALALAGVSVIDFYTAKSLTFVTYVQPALVTVVQRFELSLSTVCAIGVASIAASWAFLGGEEHRRLMVGVLAVQTLGLVLDVLALLVATLSGQHANPFYLLLEAGLVHISTGLLFASWYATLDHHRQLARLEGGTVRQRFSFPQNTNKFPGYEDWVPGFADYWSFAFTASSSLGPAEAMPIAVTAKLLVCLQVSLSLIVLLVLAARAIGLIA